MNEVSHFSPSLAGYLVKQLFLEDAETLQELYEQCSDFSFLTEGVPVSRTAARDEFDSLPEGKTPEDKYIFGLFTPNQTLIGMIEAIRHYPDDRTWWLGLMMLAVEYRGKGLGTEFYRAFERWVSLQGAAHISLAVIEANKSGLQFWKSMGFAVMRKTTPRQFGLKTHHFYVMKRVLP